MNIGILQASIGKIAVILSLLASSTVASTTIQTATAQPICTLSAEDVQTAVNSYRQSVSDCVQNEENRFNSVRPSERSEPADLGTVGGVESAYETCLNQ